MKNESNDLSKNKFLSLKKDLKLSIFHFLPLSQRIDKLLKINKKFTSTLNSLIYFKNIQKNLRIYINDEFIDKKCAFKIFNDLDYNDDYNYYFLFDIITFILFEIYKKEKSIAQSLQYNIISLLKDTIKFKNKFFFSKSILNDKLQSFNYFHFKKLHFENLSEIYLGENKFSDEGMFCFSLFTLPNLTDLYLMNNEITCLGVCYLSKMDLPNLKLLSLSGNYIGDEGINYLKNMKIPYINILGLAYNGITDLGIFYMSQMKINILSELYLDGNEISDKGIINMIGMKIPFLHLLVLDNNHITLDGFLYLKRMNLEYLNEVYLNKNLIDKEDKFFLKKNFPKTRIFL